ncbi:MAG: YceI family protein [Truepera sp.]|nr:YceI family protein [Truepera sp.]
MGKRGLLAAVILALATAAALAQDMGAPVFQLVEGTEARYRIDEVFRNRDTTAIGITPLVTGTVQFDRNDPLSTSVGTITIDARDLDGDRRARDRVVIRRILQANRDQYRYITFEPTAITGMPPLVQVGDTLELQITGMLRIRDSTNEAVFDATVRVMSETKLKGKASTTILWRDYGLRIPNWPGVSWVADEVILQLFFDAVLSDSDSVRPAREGPNY